jgi:cAMP-dependent protein kinase regulator
MDASIAANKRYLRQNVNPILELLVAELMKNQPENPVQYMRNWLQNNGRVLEDKIQQRLVNRPEGILTTSESEEMSDEEMDTVQEHVEFKKLVNKPDYKNQRVSVSAEAYGEHNKKEDFQAPVYPKSQQQKENILGKLKNSFLFSALEKKEMDIIVDAMREQTVPAGTTVIKQGDDGHELYVVNSGSLDCFKQFPNEQQPRFLLTYSAGDAFGELALLYNAPRAATIVAKTESLLFVLDRQTFNHIVKDAVIRRRNKYHQFLSKIELLDSLNEIEKDKVCDCLQISHYKPHEYIIREGDKGNTFYFILEGHCIATQKDKVTHAEKTVYEFKENDYFGELALLKDEPRAASVVAQSNVMVACIDRSSFKRLLGPLEDILKRNAHRYDTFVGK